MAYLGMDAKTGLRIGGRAHLAQSVTKVLTTPLTTRLRRRTFGATAADLIDAPTNGATILQLYAAAATALLRWEPRIAVRSMQATIDRARPGALALTIHGEADIGEESGSVTITTVLSE